MIEKCCKNCVLYEFDNSGYNYYEEYIGFEPCDNCEECSNFRAKEELVREDEKNKILNLLKDDIKSFEYAKGFYFENQDKCANYKRAKFQIDTMCDYINNLIKRLEK